MGCTVDQIGSELRRRGYIESLLFPASDFFVWEQATGRNSIMAARRSGTGRLTMFSSKVLLMLDFSFSLTLEILPVTLRLYGGGYVGVLFTYGEL
jgi:hypothetical protein